MPFTKYRVIPCWMIIFRHIFESASMAWETFKLPYPSYYGTTVALCLPVSYCPLGRTLKLLTLSGSQWPHSHHASCFSFGFFFVFVLFFLLLSSFTVVVPVELKQVFCLRPLRTWACKVYTTSHGHCLALSCQLLSNVKIEFCVFSPPPTPQFKGLFEPARWLN